ncbi:MAG TPA: C40 family peptidase [Gemmatimonadales bacterium]|nr:C40 family peptidase [Gemmatimonadales bacterium]
MRRPIRRPGLASLLLLPATLGAQGAGHALELHWGRWYNGNHANIYELRSTSAGGGLVTRGVGVAVAVHDSLGRRRAFYGLGYEVQAGRGRQLLGPYALAGVALGLSTDTATQALAAQWSVGGGLEWRPVAWLALGTELRYRLEDRGPQGFWHPRSDARRGLSATLGFAIGWGGGAGGRGSARGRAGVGAGAWSPPDVAPPEPPTAVSGTAGDVVQTAIEALGTPYVWGGTEDNGFDCSGLIQYAYGQHGIRLPRRSGDQAHAGAEVTPVVQALRPGDILLFSARPGAGVSHIGMYVGELKFIHSSSRGVKLSRLEPTDPEGAYWLDRWVGARRVLP